MVHRGAFTAFSMRCELNGRQEPTAPDDVLGLYTSPLLQGAFEQLTGHAKVRQALKPLSIGVATGEHAHNRCARSLAPLQSCKRAQHDLQTAFASRSNRRLSARQLSRRRRQRMPRHSTACRKVQSASLSARGCALDLLLVRCGTYQRTGGVGLCEMTIHLSAIVRTALVLSFYLTQLYTGLRLRLCSLGSQCSRMGRSPPCVSLTSALTSLTKWYRRALHQSLLP